MSDVKAVMETQDEMTRMRMLKLLLLLLMIMIMICEGRQDLPSITDMTRRRSR